MTPQLKRALSQCIGLLLVCRSDVLHLEPRKISLAPSAVCSHFDDRQSDMAMVASGSRVARLVSLAETSLAFASIISKFAAEAIFPSGSTSPSFARIADHWRN